MAQVILVQAAAEAAAVRVVRRMRLATVVV